MNFNAINLIHGECIEEMRKLPDGCINMILCDLPYGISACSWDCVVDQDMLWAQYKRLLKPGGIVALFSAGLFTIDLINSNRKDFKYRIIWEKNVPTGMSSAKYRPMKYYEEICIFCNGKQQVYNPIMKPRVGEKKECYRYDHYCGANNHVELGKVKKRYDPNFVQPSDVLHFNVVPNRNGKLHPTQKPVELLEYLIKTYSNEQDVILDNCMGSGSTGIACLNTGRKFIGIELDKAYFDIAKQRIESTEVHIGSKDFKSRGSSESL